VIRSDGSPERDYLHVDDAVEAYLAIAAAVVDGKAAGLAINAGHGEPVSVLKVVSTICEQIGSDLVPDVRGDGPPKGEIPRQWVDPTLIRELTGWQASISLEEGIARTIAWYRDHPGSLPVGPPPRSS
jgi:CDP-glucose 4,6-dehydratase